MVRLMLTLTPIVCVSAAVALSSVLDTYIDPTQPDLSLSKDEKVDGTKKDKSTTNPTSSSSVAGLLADMVTSGGSTDKRAKPTRRDY
jgi:dolichyl-diphosphooligosaccharide--protein glycosyltransferase